MNGPGLRRSPLHGRQRSAGARFAELAGWEVAESFGEPDDEYARLTSTVAVADRCHEGRLKIEGRDAAACLNPLTTIDVVRIAPNSEKECLVLNERGGVADQVAVFRSERFWTVHCGPAARGWLEESLRASAARLADAAVSDATTTQGTLLLAGPLAEKTLADGLMEGAAPRNAGASSILQIGQGRCLVTRRTMGALPCFVIDVGGLFVEGVWDRLVNHAGRRDGGPVGTRALETARIEAGIPRAGADMDGGTTPFEAGVMGLVEYSKKEFAGRRGLLHSMCAEFARRLVFLRFEGMEPPAAGDVVEIDGIPVGRVTSAAASPRRKCAVALAFVDAVRSTRGLMLSVRTGGGQLLFGYVSDPAEARPAAP